MPRTLLALLAVAPFAIAQTTTAVTVTNANMVYRQGPLPIATSNSFPFADLRNAGAASTDLLWSLWWYYRIAGDSMEFSLRNDSAPNAPTRTVSGSVITTTWPNVAGRGLFAATLVETLVSTGVDRGYVQAQLTLTNLTASPLAIDVFSLSDLEAGGSSVGYATNVVYGGLRSQYAEQQGSSGPGIEYYCPAADAVQVSVYQPSTPGMVPYVLTNTTVDNLSGWNGSFGPGDHNGAFQWTRTIAPSGSESFTAYSAITTQRPSQTLYGTAGAGATGLPVIATNERAILDPTVVEPRSYDVSLGNALANSIALLASSTASANILLPELHAYVDPATVVTFAAIIDGTGAASWSIVLPPNPALVGVSLYHQCFALDAASPGGLVSWTVGLQQVIGSW